MEIKYNFATLHTTSQDIKSEVGKLTAKLESVKAECDKLMGTWDGDAKLAYQTRQKEWDTAAGDLRDLLGRIQGAMEQSAIKMQAREAANKAKFE